MLARMSPLLQQRLRDQLGPAESLVWAGQPNAATFFKDGFAAWLLCVPLILICAYKVLSSLGRPMDGYDISAVLLCIIVVPIACYGLLVPWRWDRAARYTVYAITSERAFVMDGIGSASARTIAREEGAAFKCVERKDGSGDLILELERSVDSEGSERTTEHGFFAIAEVVRIGALVTALRQRQKLGMAP
jgi:hypothetical protein